MEEGRREGEREGGRGGGEERETSGGHGDLGLGFTRTLHQVGWTFVRGLLHPPNHPPLATLVPFRDGNTPLVGQEISHGAGSVHSAKGGTGTESKGPEFYEMPVG